MNSSKLPAYPYADIKRAADHLKYLFSDQSPFVLYESNQAQRTFEIIKYKLGLKSKFDGDVVLKRRIERQNLSALKQVYERREEIDSKLAKRDLIAKKSHIIDLCSSDSDESDENKKTKKNEESSEESEESEDERELMRLIERQDRIDLRNKATLSSNDSSSDVN